MMSTKRAVVLLMVVLSVVALAAIAPAGAHTGTLATHVCGGAAPTVTDCTNGSHTRGGPTLSHGVCLGGCPTFSGTIVSQLHHAGGVRAFACAVAAGLVQCAPGQGAFPAPGSAFEHRCNAVGAGTWNCYVSHN